VKRGSVIFVEDSSFLRQSVDPFGMLMLCCGISYHFSSVIPGFYSIFCTPVVMTSKSNSLKLRFLANARNDNALSGSIGERRERRYRRSRLSPIQKKRKLLFRIPRNRDEESLSQLFIVLKFYDFPKAQENTPSPFPG
jgi:hypothetical protein